jgi:hypothetical protein
MDNNKIITRETVVLETPPDENTLKTYSYDDLLKMCQKLGVQRESYDNILDDDKRKVFFISEILRVNPPFPRTMKPVLLHSEFDETKMTKNSTFKYVKHILHDGKYQNTIITEESYKIPLTQRDIHLKEKNNLINSISEEISQLDLDEYKTKEDILKFACDNNKSSGERYKRASMLNSAVINHNKGGEFTRPRITHFDISVY